MRLADLVVACACCVGMAGCASNGNGQIETLTQDRADILLLKGGTTKDDVRRALGDALVTIFPSGQEVWFYQFTGSAAQFVKYVPWVGRMTATGALVKELKILFDKNGRVEKFKLQDIRVQ